MGKRGWGKMGRLEGKRCVGRGKVEVWEIV